MDYREVFCLIVGIRQIEQHLLKDIFDFCSSNLKIFRFDYLNKIIKLRI